MGNVLVVLAEGFEEIEAISVIDILRRGGASVKTLGISGNRQVVGGHGIPVIADLQLSDGINIEETDMIVLPGGKKGTETLKANETLAELIRKQLPLPLRLMPQSVHSRMLQR